MELWIRSQDRNRLAKVNIIRVMCSNDRPYTNEIWANDNILLGKYEKEDRAIEVLDEIQEILFPKIEYTAKSHLDESLIIGWECNLPIITNNGSSIVQPLNNYVYQMPKE